jgi:hypothetical protein
MKTIISQIVSILACSVATLQLVHGARLKNALQYKPKILVQAEMDVGECQAYLDGLFTGDRVKSDP